MPVGALGRLIRNRNGATSVEVSLVAALLAVVLVTVLGEVATRVSNAMDGSATQVEAARGKMCAKTGCGSPAKDKR